MRGTVPDTDVATANFDGIIYGKGAAVIEQLHYLIGHDNFSAGLKKYFDRFAWGNTTIDDLLEDLEEYFPAEVTVQDWRRQWL